MHNARHRYRIKKESINIHTNEIISKTSQVSFPQSRKLSGVGNTFENKERFRTSRNDKMRLFYVAEYKCSRQSRENRGFTLLEIIIVLFLITLITGMSSIFLLNALPSNKLNATARTLSATIRQARTLAQIHNEGKTVFIDLDSRKYGIEGLGSKDIPSEISIKVIDPMSGEILKGTYEIAVRSGGGVEGGTIQLWTSKKAVSIQIDPVLGAVVIK